MEKVADISGELTEKEIKMKRINNTDSKRFTRGNFEKMNERKKEKHQYRKGKGQGTSCD